jgi:Tetratricopeptide repeat
VVKWRLLPDLATSLNNQSNGLSDLGRREEALAAIEEAVTIRRELLAVDWAPNDGEGDKILYVFDCGEVGGTSQIKLRDGEIDLWKWVPIGEVADYAILRLARRLTRAYEARQSDNFLYLEHGVPTLGSVTRGSAANPV